MDSPRKVLLHLVVQGLVSAYPKGVVFLPGASIKCVKCSYFETTSTFSIKQLKRNNLLLQKCTALKMCSSNSLHRWLFGDCCPGDVCWGGICQCLQSATHISLHSQSSCTSLLYSAKQDSQVLLGDKKLLWQCLFAQCTTVMPVALVAG